MVEWNWEMMNYVNENVKIEWESTSEIIKNWRKSVNMSQLQFANWISTSIENIKNWERGKSQPSEMLLKLIAYYVEGHKQGNQLKIEEEKIFYVHELTNSYKAKRSKHVYEKEELERLKEEHNYYCGENRFRGMYEDKIYKCAIIEEIEF